MCKINNCFYSINYFKRQYNCLILKLENSINLALIIPLEKIYNNPYLY